MSPIFQVIVYYPNYGIDNKHIFHNEEYLAAKSIGSICLRSHTKELFSALHRFPYSSVLDTAW